MVQLRIDPSDFLRRTSNVVTKQLPFAEALALNWTARDVVTGLKARMRVVFDRPTPFTLNAFRIQPATKARRVAVVTEKDAQGRQHFLKVQQMGGTRPQTRLERMLSTRLAYGGVIGSVIPATGGRFEAARLDAFGNWSSGERQQVLSGLGAQNDAAQNTTARSRARNPRRATYFVPKHGLAPGVYRRDQPGGIPVRVLKFSPWQARYRPRLGFDETVAQAYHERLPVNFRRALERALATSR